MRHAPRGLIAHKFSVQRIKKLQEQPTHVKKPDQKKTIKYYEKPITIEIKGHILLSSVPVNE